jgi:4-amino-4-deoxy-L-arabinose transferase-like glycosyltransferase
MMSTSVSGRSPAAAERALRWPVTIAVGLVLAVAAILRFSAISGGLPWLPGVDEPQIMVRSFTMVRTGDFNPHFFDYPGFYLYAQVAVIAARFLAGAASGTWSALAQVGPSDFYLWGRAVTAAFGTATVYLLYLAARRWGTGQALMAAAVMAVMPIHVRESHYVLTDVPMTFFVVLALVLSLRAHENGSDATFAWAGAAAGLAAGTKYTGYVSLMLPLMAAAFVSRPIGSRVRAAAIAVAAFLGAFLVVAPYTILDLPGFLDGFGSLARGTPRRPASAPAGWVIYLGHLRNALGWCASVFAGTGLVVFAVRLVRGPARFVPAMVLAFVSVFWAMIIDRSLIFGRYLMPTLPFVCLAVGAACGWIAHIAKRVPLPSRALPGLAAALVVAVLAQPSYRSIAFVGSMSRQWTLEAAGAWMLEHVKPGSRILTESPTLQFPPGRYEVEYVRSLTDKGAEFYGGEQVDFVLATPPTPAAGGRPMSPREIDYWSRLSHLVQVFGIRPSTDHPGPETRVYAVHR